MSSRGRTIQRLWAFPLRYPINELELARQVELRKITIDSINRSVVLTLEDLIPCYDVARLAVDDVNLGDEAVYFLIFIIHTYNITPYHRKVKDYFHLFLPYPQDNVLFMFYCKYLSINRLCQPAGPGRNPLVVNDLWCQAFFLVKTHQHIMMRWCVKQGQLPRTLSGWSVDLPPRIGRQDYRQAWWECSRLARLVRCETKGLEFRQLRWSVVSSCSCLLGVRREQAVTTLAVGVRKARAEKPFGVTLPHGDGFNLPNRACLVENAFQYVHNFFRF